MEISFKNSALIVCSMLLSRFSAKNQSPRAELLTKPASKHLQVHEKWSAIGLDSDMVDLKKRPM